VKGKQFKKGKNIIFLFSPCTCGFSEEEIFFENNSSQSFKSSQIPVQQIIQFLEENFCLLV